LNLKNFPLNLDFTFNCGQIFGWEKWGDYWYGEIEGSLVGIKREKDELVVKGNIDERVLFNFLSLKDDYKRIKKALSKDKLCSKLVKKYEGLRILTQDPFYCTISFICSINNNIKRIDSLVKNLKKKFGERVSLFGKDFYLFPKLEILAKADIKDLEDCGLGFRAKYVKASSQKIKEKVIDFKEISKLSYEKAWETLKVLDGVGNKVSDCILLFSLHKLEAFPIDRWIYRVVNRYYKHLLNSKGLKSYKKISKILRSYFGEYAGYAQEFLFFEFKEAK